MIKYYNVVRHDDPQNRRIETWGLFKRNASSYVNDLSEIEDKSAWRYDLKKAKNHEFSEHGFNQWLPITDLNPTNVKICIRDPLHKYCSGLVMLHFNLEEPYSRHSLMEPFYHNGGREEIINMFPDGIESEYQLRFLYCFRQFVRSIHNTFFSMGGVSCLDYTFGESHLDPALTLGCLLPYMHNEAKIWFTDLKKWTEYTTGVLGIEETFPAVDRWNTPKLQKRRDQIAQPGLNLFKVLQTRIETLHKRC